MFQLASLLIAEVLLAIVVYMLETTYCLTCSLFIEGY